ncbi:hypothetical protein [Anaeromyxobacter oryzae]|uniref:Uncharacterized protein n=1 Tax=Anaeromyxobacter oryzae TaxID=2918170 RepID=A0ABM7WYY6_9BACT|nr:hypothetical protein [Anaeromyxobacter oryzae]BDG04639.1 hypothetical protein AMOR_36350 [Anaeromyxobacter oryzae]
MDRILFGDNQFFGVNHMSEEKARAQAMKFRDTQDIMRVLDAAYDAGIRVFMCTTHDRVGEIADLVRANPARYPDLAFYPCLPYAHKYANSVGEVGILETIRRFAPGGVLETLVKGAVSAATQDVQKLMEMLVDAELKRFAGTRMPIVFVQNVVTDLLLGLKLDHLLAAFAAHVGARHGAEAGFITMNLPLLVERLERVGVVNPIVCANVNKIGFRMSGGVDAYRDVLRARRCRAIAMSVLASGAIPPREAIEWVCGLEGVDSIVFGASSAQNIRQTKALIDEAWGLAPAATLRRAAV